MQESRQRNSKKWQILYLYLGSVSDVFAKYCRKTGGNRVIPAIDAFCAVVLHRYGIIAHFCSRALLVNYCILSVPMAWQKNEDIALIRLCLGVRRRNMAASSPDKTCDKEYGMTITMGWRSRWLLPVLALGMVFQLAACGDSEADQRKAFITLLQSVPSQPGSAPPTLSEEQKKRLGPFANDYAILTTFSQQLRQSMAVSLKPLLEHVSQIRVPQDYLTQRDGVRSAVGAINLLGQQVQTAKTQADSARRNLSQPQEIQVLYERVYSLVVVQPAVAVGNVVPAAATLAQQLAQVGDFLQAQGKQVTFVGNQVQFETAQQAARYNALITPLATQQRDLMNGLQPLLPLLQPSL